MIADRTTPPQHVTLHNVNYRQLTATGCRWRERTPDNFVMAVKASRYLTHVRRLRDPAEPVARLLGAAAGLGPKLGPVLLQLPPTLKADPDTLGACLKEFRTAATALGEHGLRLAVEPRHETWWTDEIRQILAVHDATLCCGTGSAGPGPRGQSGGRLTRPDREAAQPRRQPARQAGPRRAATWPQHGTKL